MKYLSLTCLFIIYLLVACSVNIEDRNNGLFLSKEQNEITFKVDEEVDFYDILTQYNKKNDTSFTNGFSEEFIILIDSNDIFKIFKSKIHIYPNSSIRELGYMPDVSSYSIKVFLKDSLYLYENEVYHIKDVDILLDLIQNPNDKKKFYKYVCIENSYKKEQYFKLIKNLIYHSEKRSFDDTIKILFFQQKESEFRIK
jgi:hypothetical protein